MDKTILKVDENIDVQKNNGAVTELSDIVKSINGDNASSGPWAVSWRLQCPRCEKWFELLEIPSLIEEGAEEHTEYITSPDGINRNAEHIKTPDGSKVLDVSIKHIHYTGHTYDRMQFMFIWKCPDCDDGTGDIFSSQSFLVRNSCEWNVNAPVDFDMPDGKASTEYLDFEYLVKKAKK